VFEHNQEKKMKKLLSLIVAAMFAAVSVSALAASHAGAQEKKMTEGLSDEDDSEEGPAKADTAKDSRRPIARRRPSRPIARRRRRKARSRAQKPPRSNPLPKTEKGRTMSCLFHSCASSCP
jgi:Ni/Co efflux regulator RcnB